MASVLCTHVSISRSLNSFPLYKILPSIKHDAENFTSRDHFLLVEPLKFSFKTRLSFKLQRPIGGTNLNVVIVYLHRGHSGRYPRVRSQRNTPQWTCIFHWKCRGQKKKKEHRFRTEELINNTVLVCKFFYNFSKGRICLATSLQDQHRSYRHITLTVQIYKN